MTDAKDLVEQIKSADVELRYAAWNNAGGGGAEAIVPLADVMGGADDASAKAAREAMQRIVHAAGRPYAAPTARAVAAALVQVGADAARPRIVRVNAFDWIGYIGDKDSVPALVKLLGDAVVREDARLALERIPGEESLAALREAAHSVPADFQANIQQSLYNRQLSPQTSGIKAPAV